jgi:hypothetical protein
MKRVAELIKKLEQLFRRKQIAANAETRRRYVTVRTGTERAEPA